MINPGSSPKQEDQAGSILVADDDAGVGGALQLLFELNGLVAEVVRTPRDAIERVKRGGVRVVIHDMNFSRGETSGEEGLALFRELRRVAPEMSVILMTSWATASTRASVLGAGATAYLMKPWDDESLVAMVQRLLVVR